MLKMESFNELTTIVLTYFLICFTDYVPSAEVRNQVGFGYIGTNFFNIAVHLTLLIFSSLASLRRLVIRLCRKCACGRSWAQRHCFAKQKREAIYANE